MKLVAIDLDGTLLSKDSTISGENVKAINEAQEQGHVITIATGRSLHDTKRILQNAGLECPMITGNGAVVFHEGNSLKNLVIPAIVLTEMQELLEKNHFYFEIYTNKGVFILQEGRDLLYKEIEGNQLKAIDFSLEQITTEIEIQYNQYGLQYFTDFQNIEFTELEVYKLFVLTFDMNKMVNLQGKLMGREDISLTTSGKAKLEIGHPETSKGNALLFFADYLGISIKETVTIGDNLNDLSMFEIAGTSIAMENAEEAVKKQSTYITIHHDENGVAEALRKYVLS
ncbi:HAD family phosphatase [Sporosarcina sp. resist]|uniref:Cof-type HAD-IIB family hydrolase n=1 Tax=Sporosarcina sp. resist TaxID=2762563 RepID=UPI00164DBBDF|nr:Cof-type HAD-IIB family hydrolase [Sporosarcina sp. resist]QNK86824.1 HAD family phosphatase [Sporosarcina sp. resist]